VTDKVRVQNALIDAAMAGAARPFYKVTYSDAQKLSLATSGGSPVLVLPKEAFANEVRTEYGEAAHFRRYRRLERTGWTWELRLSFDQEVVCEAFEESLADPPILLPSDKTLGYAQVTLAFQFADYTHPPTQQARTGTKVTYTFEAQRRRA
jgi:hypothetical protein